MSLKDAKETFEKAQVVALELNDELGELMAIGMMELTTALQIELRRINSNLDDVESRVKRLG